nr:hypothetical protein [uncultured Flavobacterium sp.]
MITNYKKHHRCIATFFLLIFFPTLLPNNLFASTNGPKSPEAASFEPVDATDMVNLITGQYSYVLPLLNVPSPEGGYPLALSYHAGIAMDQNATWAGLGWNVNPGSIERSVNGYADDYSNENITEYFYDSSKTVSISSVSVAFSNGGGSVGLGFNWGSDQSLGGSVSIGYGFKDASGFGVGGNASVGFGSNSGNFSIGAGVISSTGLSIGVNVSTGGNLGITMGHSNTNGEGFSLGYNTSGNISGSVNLGSVSSIGLDISSKGATFNLSALGSGGNTSSFSNTLQMGDYNTRSSEWMVPLSVPTPIGVFSLSFGKQSFTYYLSKNKNTLVSGLLNFNISEDVYIVHLKDPNISNYVNSTILSWFTNLNSALLYREQMMLKYPNLQVTVNQFPGSVNGSNYVPGGDIHEFSVADSINNENNNFVLPNYDNFNVTAQGLAGNFTASFYENNALRGYGKWENSSGYSVSYENTPGQKFTKKPEFYFENEISTYLNTTDVLPVVLDTSTSYPQTITGYFNYDPNPYGGKLKRRTSRGIRYWLNGDIVKDNDIKYSGFLNTNSSSFDRSKAPSEGIGAFEITAADGKTYHYSLPVYNHEIITRTYGMIPGHQNENQAYMEKRQLKPFATHWLLTGVTGPDFVDNGDGVIGEGDLGYYTSFDYGLWSDSYIWNQSDYKDAYTDISNPNIKTWIKGRKQIYYLDRITTRTHTAVFIKEIREDAKSKEFTYNSVIHEDNRELTTTDYTNRFSIPTHKLLKLSKILLFKNNDFIVSKSFGSDMNTSLSIDYSKNYVFKNPMQNPGVNAMQDILRTKKEITTFNNYDNIFDINDNWGSNISKVIKVIDFNYDYSLYKGENCLTLKSVNFKGKADTQILPPYRFDYENSGNNVTFSDFDKNTDSWGYYSLKPDKWSLKQITTPSGAKISMDYESNKLKSALPHTLDFSGKNSDKYTSTFPNYASSTDLSNKKIILTVGKNDFPIKINQIVKIDYFHKYQQNGLLKSLKYLGDGHVSNILLGDGVYEVTFDGNVTQATSVYPSSQNIDIVKKIDVNLTVNSNAIYTGAGTRVKKISISDAFNTFSTEYKYGSDGDGIGYVSYIPFVPNLDKEVPYSADLPAPRVMYEYVYVNPNGSSGLDYGKIRYKFNIIKEKSVDKIKFGNFFELEINEHNLNNQGKNVSVNNYKLKDNLNSIGQLLEVAIFNSKNQILNKISNVYYENNSIPNNYGVSQESYQTYKTIDYTNPSLNDKWVINTSTRIKYPSILKFSSEQNNGYTYTTQFLDYDELSGVSKEQLMFSSDGKMLKNKLIPAFRKYPDMAGGYFTSELKSKNINMLSQIAAYYTYVNQNGTWKETSVGINTWSNLWQYRNLGGDIEPYKTVPNYFENNYSKSDLYKYSKQFIWRKHKTFIWNGKKDNDGIFMNFDSTNDDGFNWLSKVYSPGYPNSGLGDPIPKWIFFGGNDEQPVQWKQTSEVTLYNHFSAPLEIKDINGNFAATKMGDNNTKIMVTGNAGYNEMFYCGAENTTDVLGVNWLESDIKMTNAARTNRYAHSGKLSVEATSSSEFGVLMKNNEHRTGKYKVSVWVHKSSVPSAALYVNNNFIAFTDSYTAGNWVLKSAIVNFNKDTAYAINVKSANSTAVYLDDLMIRPVSSTISGYVYNEWDELTHIIGNNGLATRFEYDAAGRLIKTYIEVLDDADNGISGGFKLKSVNKINYKGLTQ